MQLKSLIRAGLALVVLTGATTALATTGGIENSATCCETAVRLTPPSTLPPLPPSDDVVIIGDSLFAGVVWSSVLGANTIQAILQSTGRDVFTDAEIGRNVAGGLRVVWENRARVGEADVALIGLGTNDLFDNPGLGVTRARELIDRMVTALRAANPHIRIVWVDVSVERLYSRTVNWNAALEVAAEEIPAFEVCRWREIALANPSWSTSDGVHLTVTGYKARRDVLINCVLYG